MLAQGDDIVPIPGTKRVSRVEENTAADGIELSAEQLQRLNHLTPATGERHDEGEHGRSRPLITLVRAVSLIERPAVSAGIRGCGATPSLCLRPAR
jgi:hypothetical protein